MSDQPLHASHASGGQPLTGKRITDDLVAPCFRWPPLVWWGAFLTAFGIAQLLFISVAMYCIEGYGIFGPSNTVNWGNDIASYVFWIGIAVAGTLVSSILFLFRQRWRTGINRSTEAMTVFAINIAGMYPLIHTGRPWVDYWLIPHPNDLSLWPQFKSPIMWDVFAMTGYATTSVLFFYYGLIPDFAVLRDRATHPLQKRIYSVLAMNWKGSARNWAHYERAYTQFAWIATPLVVGMHSTIAILLAVTHLPGWHATIFPPYFVSGAIFGGLAMALVLLVPIRATLRLHDYITVDHLERIAKIMLAVGMIVFYVYCMEFFAAWWSESTFERDQFIYRVSGAHAWTFWAMIACNVVALQLFWFKTLRRNLAVLIGVGLLVNVGMWLERFNIVVLSLENDHIPTSWVYYSFTAWDYILLAGSFGVFFTQFLVFCRVAPIVSIAEVKGYLLNRRHHVDVKEREAEARRADPDQANRGAAHV